MAENLLEIKNLEVQYLSDGEIIRAVNGIDLSVGKGEVLGLVGETGAGKTTTALSILGLLPKYVSRIPRGEILFGGRNLLAASPDELRKIRGEGISMIFQDPMTSLNPVIRVGSQVAEVLKLHNPELSANEISRRVAEIFTMVGIPPARSREYPHQFSGGMKQRVMIAIAIACRPALLIADEPTTALDVTIQAQVIRMMRALIRELDSSVIMITHDLGIVANICDSVAIMYAGEIVEYGRLEEVFDRGREHHPYTGGLFGSLPNIKEHVRRLNAVPGLMPDPGNLPCGCKYHPRCPKCTEVCRQGEAPVVRRGDHRIRCHHVEGGGGNA